MSAADRVKERLGLGDSSMPTSFQQEWEFARESAGKHAGRDGSTRAGGAPKEAKGAERNPMAEHLEGYAGAVTARRSRWPLRRYRRTKACARGNKLKAARHREIAGELLERLPQIERGRAADFLVSSVLVYLVTYGAVVFVLEATGMLSSLASYDSTLGDMKDPMAFAAGGILVLAGHGIGKLLHRAWLERSRKLWALGAAIFVVAVVGFTSIAWMGDARDRNLAAAAKTGEVGTLRSHASKLDRQAQRLENPIPGRRRAQRPSGRDRRAAADLRAQAEQTRTRADSLQREADDGRTLQFFILVQSLGLLVGALGGFFFTETADIREHRVLSRRARRRGRWATRRTARAIRQDAKAADRLAHVWRIGEEMCQWARDVYGMYRLELDGPRRGTLPPLSLGAADVVQGLLVAAGVDPADMPDEDAEAAERKAGRRDDGEAAATAEPSGNGADPVAAER